MEKEEPSKLVEDTPDEQTKKSEDEDNDVTHYGCDHYKRKSKFVVRNIF